MATGLGIQKLAKANPAKQSAAVHNLEDRAFFGHPRGLGYIAFTEAWERFSYYGMQSLLVLYMVRQLLHPGHIEYIAGFVSFRHFLESLYVLNSIGFANVFPVSLALYARVAPAALSATIIGIYYLAFFAANNLVGTIGSLLEKMPATYFWLLHDALCGTAGIIFLLAGHFFGYLLAPGDKEAPS